MATIPTPRPLLPADSKTDSENALPAEVVWDSPSSDARGSMPLGNGDIALNAWVDTGGDLLFYIGKTDTWEDNSRLAKVGLVRVQLIPGLLSSGGAFAQRLVPARGEIVVTMAPEVTLRLWVDANHPTIQVEVEAVEPVAAAITFELWRTHPVTLPTIEVSDVNLDRSKPDHQRAPTVVEPDMILSGLEDSIGWYHHNRKSVGPVETMAHQDLLGAPWTDPILHRTFGAVIRSPGASRVTAQRLMQGPAKRHEFSVHVLTQHPSSPEQWLAGIKALINQAETVSVADRYAQHVTWWREFWSRSHIAITAAPDIADAAAPREVTRGYALQRFITACAGRGAFPIKFNGSLFTVPWPDQPGDADYRRWGPGYWWQNTRLPYAGLCTSGDWDMLESFHRMFAGEVTAVSRYRAQRYYNFTDAAYMPECIHSWGAVFGESYGWETTAAERTDKLQTSGYHKWEWVSGLEFVFMLLDYFDHTGDRDFLVRTLIPAARLYIRFFDCFYETGPEGKLVMHPAQALETWWDSTNPMPEVAGLHAVIGRLLALPNDLLPGADRNYLMTLREKLPPLPIQEVDGVRLLAPAEKFANKRNIENAELYAVFPFRLVSFEKDNAGLGVEALVRRMDRGAFGWRQEDIFMAYLGLANEARDYVVERARNKDPACRFPAFWGPNYDWTPDQCHGGVLMKAVQAMLMQTEGDAIYLLPAWPVDWEVQFKLHAPGQTVVEAKVRGGKMVDLKVTPESRRKDVVLNQAFQ
ncbi:MAG: DUF5703 domain-containing protein [Cephaloticoccus sp.]|nr:DUF5703 domain-containing protein [Cephaloticoccus sp.]MCF7759557.1 DUF5703 domain-containing protein [Cephaloticoccus sp.]